MLQMTKLPVNGTKFWFLTSQCFSIRKMAPFVLDGKYFLEKTLGEVKIKSMENEPEMNQ